VYVFFLFFEVLNPFGGISQMMNMDQLLAFSKNMEDYNYSISDASIQCNENVYWIIPGIVREIELFVYSED